MCMRKSKTLFEYLYFNLLLQIVAFCSNAGVVPDRYSEQGPELESKTGLYVPILTYSHELWAGTERMRLWIQAAKLV